MHWGRGLGLAEKSLTGKPARLEGRGRLECEEPRQLRDLGLKYLNMAEWRENESQVAG